MADTSWIPKGVDVDALRAQEEDLRVRVRELHAQLEVVRGILQTLSRQKTRRATANSEAEGTRLRQIIEVLESSETPLSVAAIYERLRKLDPALKWTNPAPVFRSYLRRQSDDSPDKVVPIERGLYGLRRKHALSSPPDGASRTDAPIEPKRNGRGAILVQAEAILREEGGPLSVEEIVRRLQARGIQQRATHPADSLKTNLRRHGAFVHIGSGKFDLHERRHGNDT